MQAYVALGPPASLLLDGAAVGEPAARLRQEYGRLRSVQVTRKKYWQYTFR
jgi:hypothetical protein